MPSLAEHLNWRVKGWRHARLARGVLDTPPLRGQDDGVVIFSMIGTRVLLPYLVAVKSFGRSLGRGRVVVLDDGTLTVDDRAVLRRHLDPELPSIADVDTGACPTGGTWERLLTILDRRRDAYVIQLDSDTVTTGDLGEIRVAIDANRSFSLRGEAGAELLSAPAFAAARAPLPPGRAHVQRAFEAVVEQVRVPALRYFRGCSGFAGFARRDAGRGLAEQASAEGERLLGAARWREWGTEQLTSNLVIANEPDPLLLPYARYLNFWDRGVPADARLVHFLGTCRFHGETYLRATRDAIARLSA